MYTKARNVLYRNNTPIYATWLICRKAREYGQSPVIAHLINIPEWLALSKYQKSLWLDCSGLRKVIGIVTRLKDAGNVRGASGNSASAQMRLKPSEVTHYVES
jgi:hypothetical protein